MILDIRCRACAIVPALLFFFHVSLPAQTLKPAFTSEKVYTAILSTVKQLTLEGITPENAAAMSLAERFKNSLVRFDSRGRIGLQLAMNAVTPAALTALQNVGANVLLSIPGDRLIVAYVPIDRIDAVANLQEVRLVRPITGGVTNAVKSEGDSVHRAINVRTDLTVRGANINVGVISDGCASWAQAVASGDLPATFGPPNFIYLGGANKIGIGDEGTAMMEIVHDLAPSATLYFYGALYDALGSFAHRDAIHRLVREKQCQIIVDDLTWYDQPMFEDGDANTVNTVAEAAQWAIDTGVVYISSAGNWADGPPNIITRSHYQALYFDNNPHTNNGVKPIPPPFTPPPPLPVPPIPIGVPDSIPIWPYNDLHNFNTSSNIVDAGLMVTIAGFTGIEPKTLNVILEWADQPGGANDPDPWGGSADDYDLYLYDQNFTRIITASTITQNGAQDPREQLTWTNYGVGDSIYNIVINHLDTLPLNHPPKLLGMYISGCKWVEYFTPQNSIWGQPGITPVIAVGAVPWSNVPTIESFSSHGNYDVYLPAFESRPKPDVLAVDGVQISGAGGSFLPPFFGTSASAPHVAALAALLLSKCPQMTPAEVHAKFERTAIPLTPSFDPVYGNGFADIERALLEVDTAKGQTAAYTLNNTNVPMFYATGKGYAMNTVTITGGAQQPGTVTSALSVTAGSAYTDAGVPDLGCPTINRWYQLTQNGGAAGGFNADITAYIDESERTATGVPAGNLRILHWNGSSFDILPQAVAPRQVANTWVLKATYNNASFSPFFVGYLTRGIDASAISGNSGMPDSTVAVQFSIHNTGNGWDTLSTQVSDVRGWTIAPTDSSFSLKADSSLTLTVMVTISPSDTAGIIDTIRVTATSLSDGTVIDSAFVTVTVVQSVRTVTLHLTEGWNMVALPLTTGDRCRWTLFPTAVSKAFAYAGGYIPLDTLDYCSGYWINMDSTRDIQWSGQGREEDTIYVAAQWNMIGGLSEPVDVDSIVQSPANIVNSSYFGYTGSYTLADSIHPGVGYWIRTKQAGQLILHKHEGGMLPGEVPKARNIFPSLNALRFTAGTGKVQTLYVGDVNNLGTKGWMYDLPPCPPAGSFDVRFSSGRYAEVLPAGTTSCTMDITLRSDATPIRVESVVRDKRLTLSLLDASGHAIQAPAILPAETERLKLVLSTGNGVTVARSFILEQNTPNPFNPSTSIRFHLPLTAYVTLTVRSVLGDEVAKVLDGALMESGEQNAVLDGRNLPSGVYFYTLTALPVEKGTSAPFVSTKKMLLIR